MKSTFYVLSGGLFVAAVFANCSENAQVLAWAKLFDVLTALVVVFYIALWKMKPQTSWHGFGLALLAIAVVAPFTIVCVSDLSEAWGHRMSQVFSPDEALVDASDSGLQLLSGAKETFKTLYKAAVTADPQVLASSKGQVHWWIAYVAGFVLICSLIYRGSKR